jgi:hypothetical protein
MHAHWNLFYELTSTSLFATEFVFTTRFWHLSDIFDMAGCRIVNLPTLFTSSYSP